MPRIILTKKFTFEAAHKIPGHPTCGEIHGHSWVLKISVDGEINPKTGMVIDFHKMKEIVTENIIDKLDHKYLNDIFTMPPTCENLIVWMWKKLEPVFFEFEDVQLQKIELAETVNNYTSYCGN